MQCPNCGAEIGQNSRVCEYCNSQITLEMQKAQEQMNKAGCPRCGSTNITYNREMQGELRGETGTRILYNTVGLCKDCGLTWTTDYSGAHIQPRRKTWLWVLGWIFIFPVPLMLILLKKKDMNPVLKYGIIVVAWALYMLIGFKDSICNTSQLTSADHTTDSVTVDQM